MAHSPTWKVLGSALMWIFYRWCATVHKCNLRLMGNWFHFLLCMFEYCLMKSFLLLFPVHSCMACVEHFEVFINLNKIKKDWGWKKKVYMRGSSQLNCVGVCTAVTAVCIWCALTGSDWTSLLILPQTVSEWNLQSSRYNLMIHTPICHCAVAVVKTTI